MMHLIFPANRVSRLSLLLTLLYLSTASVALASGTIEQVEYPPSTEAGKLKYGVTFSVWIPDGVPTLRGVIVHQHGCGSGACKGGATAAWDLHWQALARKWDCALLGPSYHQEDGQDCRQWCDPRNGSSEAFMNALQDLSIKTKHPELANVPWCLWGHSGGGFWASIMQTKYPERIVAIWFRSGTAFATWEKGDIPKPEIPAAAYDIPMMLNPGGKEKDDKRFAGAWTGSMDMFNAYRAKGALVAFTPDPRTAHECGDSRYMAIPFFDACLSLRLPDKGSADQKLKAIPRDHGWRAVLLTDKVEPVSDFHGEAATSVWLPDERTARAWSEYVRTGAVEDQSPPPAPSAVQTKPVADQGIQLTWDAAADFESGIREFLILRDGVQIGQVPTKPIGRFGRPLFQSMSYHDTPEAPVPDMTFLDKTGKAGAKYEVITVNSVGLKSPAAINSPAK